MRFREIFDMRGTEAQITLVRETIEKIFFPFDRLITKGSILIGWENLDDEYFEQRFDESYRDGERFYGNVEGNKQTLGVFYPYSGDIYLNSEMFQHVSVMKTVLASLLSRAVDTFLPLTDDQRSEIMGMLYGTERGQNGDAYYELYRQTFMPLFTLAYSDMIFENLTGFPNVVNKDMDVETRRIIGIHRTDSASQPMSETNESNDTVEPVAQALSEPVPDTLPTDALPYPLAKPAVNVGRRLDSTDEEFYLK